MTQYPIKLQSLQLQLSSTLWHKKREYFWLLCFIICFIIILGFHSMSCYHERTWIKHKTYFTIKCNISKLKTSSTYTHIIIWTIFLLILCYCRLWNHKAWYISYRNMLVKEKYLVSFLCFTLLVCYGWCHLFVLWLFYRIVRFLLSLGHSKICINKFMSLDVMQLCQWISLYIFFRLLLFFSL